MPSMVLACKSRCSSIGAAARPNAVTGEVEWPSKGTQARIRSGMSEGTATMSAKPAVMALRGIESNCADEGSWATVRPPTAFSACNPSVPSDPMPDSTTPMAREP